MPTENMNRELRLSMQDLQDVIRIIVGPGEVEFSCLRSLISIHSDFFRLACSPQWESGRTNVVRLQDDSPEIVAIFLSWVQTGQLESSSSFIQIDLDELRKEPDSIKNSIIMSQWDQLCLCMVCGDLLQAHGFQNRVMDLLVRNYRIQQLLIRQRFPQETLQYIYQHTHSSSKLRQLILDSVITQPAHDISYDLSLPGIAEFMVDLACYAMSEAKTSRLRDKPCEFRVPWKNDPCRYHIHPGQPKAFSCMGIVKAQLELRVLE